MQKKFLIIPLVIGINFSNLVITDNSIQSQSANTVQQENINQFWTWYQKLNEPERASVRAFIKDFLLGEGTLSEDLKPFSNNRSQALKLSNFVEQAERSPQLKEILTCVANDGGDGCAPQ